MTTLDWHDLHMNGMSAISRALETLQRELAALANQQALLAHRMDALLKTQATQGESIEELQYLLSEEIMAQLLAQPPVATTPSEVVAELGHGWQIERQLAANPASITIAGIPSDSWQDDGWVRQYVAATEAE